MKITKFIKQKSNKYTVEFNNGTSIKLYDDTIVKYNLLTHKELTEEELKTILEDNDKQEAYYKSLKYLTKKLRTEKEMIDYIHKDYPMSIVTKTIDRLKLDGYLNEELYLKAYLQDQINLGYYGPNKIKKDLVKLGFTESDINPKVDNIPNTIWIEKLNHLIDKRIKSNHQYSNIRLKEKILYD